MDLQHTIPIALAAGTFFFVVLLLGLYRFNKEPMPSRVKILLGLATSIGLWTLGMAGGDTPSGIWSIISRAGLVSMTILLLLNWRMSRQDHKR